MDKALKFLTILALLWVRPASAQLKGVVTSHPLSVSTVFPGWTFLQDSLALGCNVGAAFCTFPVITTTTGSAWMVDVVTSNNVTIKYACQGSSNCSASDNGFTLCPASACHNFTSAGGNQNQDALYSVSGSAGISQMTVTLSGASSGQFIVLFYELLPPSGFTAAFDSGGAITSTSCSTCTGVGLTLTGVDAVVQFTNNGAPGSGFNPYSSPYISDGFAQGLALNITSGTAPTFTMTGSSYVQFTALAFKTTASFTSSPKNTFYNIANLTFLAGSGGGTISCTPVCPGITIPSTTSGNLIYIFAASPTGVYLSSFTCSPNACTAGSSNEVVPAGCQATQTSADAISCGYVLSIPGSDTTITPTMASSSVTGFQIFETSRVSGSFALDACNSGTNASGTSTPSGVALAITGSNDVSFQGFWGTGGSGVPSLYPYFRYLVGSDASAVYLLNTVNGTAPIWPFQQPTNATTVNGCAFK